MLPRQSFRQMSWSRTCPPCVVDRDARYTVENDFLLDVCFLDQINMHHFTQTLLNQASRHTLYRISMALEKCQNTGYQSTPQPRKLCLRDKQKWAGDAENILKSFLSLVPYHFKALYLRCRISERAVSATRRMDLVNTENLDRVPACQTSALRLESCLRRAEQRTLMSKDQDTMSSHGVWPRNPGL